MVKGLEALGRLVGNRIFVSLGRTQGKRQFAIDMNTIEKELKALEIVREKKVNVSLFLEYNTATYEDYVATFKKVNVGHELLTREEFDLLKEVLL